MVLAIEQQVDWETGGLCIWEHARVSGLWIIKILFTIQFLIVRALTYEIEQQV